MVCCLSARLYGQDVPLRTDPDAALLPAWISRDDAELTAHLVYVWSEGGTQILHAIGNFEYRLGPRVLRSREAVLWLTPQAQGERYAKHFEIFLWQDAAISYPGGVQTTGPALFATADTYGEVTLAAVKQAAQSNAAARVFQDAVIIREAYRAGELGDQTVATGGPFTTIDLGREPKRQPVVAFRGGMHMAPQSVRGHRLAVSTTGFTLTRSTAGGEGDVEVQADAAVLFIKEQPADADNPQAEQPAFNLQDAEPSGVYLEGDVQLKRGDRLMVRARKLYYDLQNNRALIIDPIMRFYVQDRPVPLYVRAAEARQLSSAEFSVRQARVSSSEFYTPHYHIGAQKLYFARGSDGGALEDLQFSRSGDYEMSDATFNLLNVPILYWPYARGNFEQGETAFRSLRVGNDDDFGFQLETRWHLFPLLAGRGTPEGFRFSYLDLDSYSDRGLGLGTDSEYQFDDSFGETRGYYIYDQEDEDELGPIRDEDIAHPNRGRATWRHRQFLDQGWDLTLEGSYISDENFLEEYFEKEFDTEKEQETYAQLRKQHDNWAFTLIGQVRILNWLQQTERLPESTFRLVGQPLGPMTVFSENRAGIVRYRPDERRAFISERNTSDNRVRSGATLRGDTRQEADFPVRLGLLKLVPFAVARGSWWDDTPRGSHLSRAFGMVGLRGSSYLSRVFEDFASEFWDLSGLRHVIKVDFTGWLSAANHDSQQMFPFDEGVEDIDDFSGAAFGMRQRWQTRRGEGDNKRIVDVLTLDIEGGFFSHAQGKERTNGYVSPTRPEESITSNHLSGKINWRVSDTTVLLADGNYDTDEGDLDIANVSLAVEHTPRFSYFTGWRLIGETDSNLFGFGFNYKASEKHRFGFRSYFDLDRGRTEQVDVTYIRKFPRWYTAFTFELDEIEDNASVSLSVWPEGFPSAALGSKRYTGLASSAAIESPE